MEEKTQKLAQLITGSIDELEHLSSEPATKDRPGLYGYYLGQIEALKGVVEALNEDKWNYFLP